MIPVPGEGEVTSAVGCCAGKLPEQRCAGTCRDVQSSGGTGAGRKELEGATSG